MAEDKAVILAIDDMPEALASINEILGDDYDVRLAKSAAAAMTLLRTEKVDVILLDIEMPIFSGFDFHDYVKAKPDMKSIPILWVTAEKNPAAVEKAMSSGAAGFLSKPFTADMIKTEISKILCAAA
jgi:CheY-like chemotaxis protein